MNNRKKILMSISACNKNNHAYVDLGLPSGTKWATCNIGATNPEDYGLYFAWGETTGYNVDQVTSGVHIFDWASYKYGNSTTTLTKYNTSSSYGTVDNKTTLELADDAARVNWGGSWKMPTQTQIQELCNSNYTTSTVETVNGVTGRRLTSKTNGNSIFIPFSGYCSGLDINDTASTGLLWTSSLNSRYTYGAYRLSCNSSSVNYFGYTARYIGYTIRPVL